MIFSPATTPHVWRTTWATVSIIVFFMLAVYWIMDGPVMWLIRQPWWGDFPSGPISA